MKILLTGGSGFLGKSFIKEYGGKYEITAPTAEEMDLNKFEQINRQFKNKSFDAVVHFAAKPEQRAGDGINTANLVFFKNIQYAAIVNGVKKLIVASDAADLDRAGGIINASEKDFGKSIPADGYGLGQYLINLLAGKDKISTVLRFFGVYGENANPETNEAVRIIKDIKRKKNVSVGADRRISAVYASDALKIVSAFLENDFPKGQYNVVPDEPTTYYEIAKKAKAAAKKNGREIKLTLDPDAVLDELTGVNANLRKLLPNFKFTSVGRGVAKTYDGL